MKAVVFSVIVALLLMGAGLFFVTHHSSDDDNPINLVDSYESLMSFDSSKTHDLNNESSGLEQHDIEKEVEEVKAAVPQKNVVEESDSAPESALPAPNDLVLPLLVDDIDIEENIFSPFGLVRSSADGELGHNGIDIPISFDDIVVAVADGKIIENTVATDGGGGYVVRLLVQDGDQEGEGWVFRYDNVELTNGIDVGSTVKKATLLGRSRTANRSTHFGLEYMYDNYTESTDHRCWIQNLRQQDRDTINIEFEILRVRNHFKTGWEKETIESMYPYRKIITTAELPQLCYPRGTDYREPVN